MAQPSAPLPCFRTLPPLGSLRWHLPAPPYLLAKAPSLEPTRHSPEAPIHYTWPPAPPQSWLPPCSALPPILPPSAVAILKSNPIESIQNRTARALGNLAMDPESSQAIHDAGEGGSDPFWGSHDMCPPPPGWDLGVWGGGVEVKVGGGGTDRQPPPPSGR